MAKRQKHKSPAAVKAEARARSNANLRSAKGNAGPRPPRLAPSITPDRVDTFTKLTAAGLSPSDALAYIAPDYHASLTDKPLAQWVTAWCSSPLVVAAVDAWNHGAWQELTPDVRVTLALDHHIAQLAYVLYTSDYTSPAADFQRIRDARQVLLDWVKTSGKVEDAMSRAIRDILEGKIAPSGPPQLASVAAVLPQTSTGTAAAKPQGVPRPH